MIGKTHSRNDRVVRQAHTGVGGMVEEKTVHQPQPRGTEPRVDDGHRRPGFLAATADTEHMAGYDTVYGWY